MKKEILGIKIDDVSIEQAVGIVEKWLNDDGKHYIVTPNPEIVLMAQKDQKLKEIINNADLAIPDGGGLKLASVKNVIYGTDFMEKLVERYTDWGHTVGFLGGRDKVAERCAERLKSKYPKLKVSFARGDIDVDNNGEATTHYPIPTTRLLFVAFGPPKQEKWIAKNLPELNVKVAMGVGGAFDFLSKTVPRAPKWLRNLGLEWLFRLIVQPWRIKRQLALLKYLWLIMIR